MEKYIAEIDTKTAKDIAYGRTTVDKVKAELAFVKREASVLAADTIFYKIEGKGEEKIFTDVTAQVKDGTIPVKGLEVAEVSPAEVKGKK